MIVRTEEEIDEVLDDIASIRDQVGTKFSGMSYEEGLEAMYNWLTDESEVNPLED